jgi:signal transduction histidine kinase
MNFFGDRLRRFNLERLWVRLLGNHIFLVVVPALLIGLLAMDTARRELREAVLNGQQSLAQRAAAEGYHFLAQRLLYLKGVALAMNVERAAWQRQSLLNQLTLGEEGVREVHLVDTLGIVQATSVLDLNATLRRGRRLPPGFLPEEEVAWRRVRQQDNYISDLVLDQGLPCVVAALPVTESEKVTGVLMARLNFHPIWEKIDQIKLGNTGHGVLLDQQYRFIAHSDRQKIFRQETHPQAEALRQSDAGVLQWRDEQGTAWVAGFKRLESLGWTLVVEQQADEAFSAVAVMRQRTGVIVAASIIGAVFLGMLLLQSITRPLKLLMSAVRRMQGGELPTLQLPKRGDEFGELGKAFAQMSEALQIREQDLVQASRLGAIGELAAGVAHEIKNPLAIMQSACYLLQSLAPSDLEERDKALRALREAIHRVNHRIEELLNLARPAQQAEEEVEVRGILGQLVDLTRKYAADRGVSIVEDLQPVPVIRMNRDALKDVFLNLITNALDAMPGGGTLSLRTQLVAEDILVEIRDTGVGIPADILDKVFDPFFSTKPGAQGTGLGLTLVRRQLTAAGGRIQIASEAGKGTRVAVYLPVRRTAP